MVFVMGLSPQSHSFALLPEEDGAIERLCVGMIHSLHEQVIDNFRLSVTAYLE